MEYSVPYMGNYDANLRFLATILPQSKKKSIKILEIGSGRGVIIKYLREEGYDVVGTEYGAEFIQQGKELYGDQGILEMNGEDLRFPDSTFDIVISLDVFEHIPDSDKHLQEVSRVLKTDGIYCLGTPNKWTNTPYEILRTKSFTSWREEHCSLHNFWQLKNRLRKNGFDPKPVNVPIINEKLLAKLQARMGKLFVGLLKLFNPDKMPFPLKTNFYVCATVKK